MARKQQQVLVHAKVLSHGQLARMKHVELMCELMLSAHQEDVINRKAALDRVMSADNLTERQVREASGTVLKALNRIIKMFPKLRTTRLRQLTDFYSLTVLMMKFEKEGLILTDKKRNRLAWGLLETFCTNVDKARENQRKAIGTEPEQEIYRSYLLTVSQMSDDLNQRRKREDLLRSILGSLFAKKDPQRSFSVEQRRIIWSTTTKRKCGHCGCELMWQDFTIDHIDPHSKGGQSRLNNAALLCRRCNSSKGNRKRR